MEIIYVPKYIYLIETYKIKDWTSIFLDGVCMIISDHKQIIVENTLSFFHKQSYIKVLGSNSILIGQAG